MGRRGSTSDGGDGWHWPTARSATTRWSPWSRAAGSPSSPWLIPSTGATVGEIRSYDERPWEYGPAPALLGATHGQELRAHTTTADEQANPSDAQPWAFDIEDPATGMVRSWLPVLDSTASEDRQPTVRRLSGTLAHRTR